MSVTKKTNLKTETYRCPDDIKNFKIRVTLKKLCSVMPKAPQNDSNNTEIESKIFSWQQKAFSRSEIEYYSNENNCLTDLEKHYHEVVSNGETSSRLFSYVHADGFCHDDVTTELSPRISELCREISNLSLQKLTQEEKEPIYDMEKCLKRSIKKPFSDNSYEEMCIMADCGNSDAESNIWIKSEHILCIIKYDSLNKLLWIYPDFSGYEPYTLEVVADGKMFYEYTIENVSNVSNSDKEEEILLKILKHNQQLKSQTIEKNFLTVPKRITRVFLFFEILTAENFDCDEIYIQYHVELPENWSCQDEDTLFGSTQTSKMAANGVAHFGYNFSISLEYNTKQIENNPLGPFIYFQVISRDFWDRYRVEGITYKCIPFFTLGQHNLELECIRILPKNSAGNIKRFVAGDYSSFNDISWAGIPTDYEESTINKYNIQTVGTGKIEVRINVVNQINSLNGGLSEISDRGDISNHMSNTSLVKSIAEVVTAFRRARDRMSEARNNVLELK